MSTDTAFALGVLAIVGRRLPLRLRAFVLTFAVVDELVALLVIATVYATATSLWPLVLACGLFALLLLAARLCKQRGVLCLAFAIAIWSAVSCSGIDPVVVGLGPGLITFAAPATRTDLERSPSLFWELGADREPALALVQCDYVDVNQCPHVWATREGISDHRATVGLPNEHDGPVDVRKHDREMR
jgi:Na+/H+ antiporter NhaA